MKNVQYGDVTVYFDDAQVGSTLQPQGNRCEQPIRFDEPFNETPNIIVSLTGFKFGPGETADITCGADNVRNDGFTAYIARNDGQALNAGSINWVAFGKTC